MASLFEATLQQSNAAERDFLALLTTKKEPTFVDFDLRLTQCRVFSESVIFQDFELASKNNVEERLWDAHTKLNARYRKYLSRFRDEEGKKKPVEKRKLKKHYLDFIKSSQRFYRGYIQRLASHFGGLPEIDAVAKKCNLDTLSADTQLHVSPEIRRLIVLSCYGALIRLGDLSRYRETDYVEGDQPKNWAPAVGYYGLAGELNPDSGTSHNQLAVIALRDGNHMRALYYLYRALMVKEPHPTGQSNLGIEYKKILSLQSKNQLFGTFSDGKTPGNILMAWFMCLHARCNQGVEFTQHDDLENEFLTSLTIELKERPLEGTLQRLTLMNFAAQHLAQKRFEDNSGSDESRQSFLFFFRLNVKTFFTLLQILQPELERFVGQDSTGDDPDSLSSDSDRLTAVARRVLPGLRNYSTWLSTNSNLRLLVNYGSLEDTALSVQVREFWMSYTHTLTLIAGTFQAGNLPMVDYLLEEDEDTVGFAPLMNEETKLRYETVDGVQKPRWRDPGMERSHPNVEFLYRIREFLVTGLQLTQLNELTQTKRAPIDLTDDGRFVFREDGIPSERLAVQPNGHHHSMSTTSIEREDIQQAKQNGRHVDAVDAATTTSFSAGTDLENMVNDIVGSEPQTTPHRRQHEFITPTPPTNTFNDGADYNTPQGLPKPYLVTDVVQQMMRTPSGNGFQPRPVLPSIEHSPFAVRPGESPQSRPATARRISPPQGTETFVLQSFPMSASNSQTGFGRHENHRTADSTPLPYPQQPQEHANLKLQLQQSSYPEQSTATSPSQPNFAFGSQYYSRPRSAYNGFTNNNHGGLGGEYYSSATVPDMESTSSPRNFGAIGGPVLKGKTLVANTPPSGQGG